MKGFELMDRLSATKEQMTYFEIALVAALLLLLGSLVSTFYVDIINLTTLIKALAVAAVSLFILILAVIVTSFCTGYMIANWEDIYHPKDDSTLGNPNKEVENAKH
jgi:hypothetical protein